MTNWGPVEQKVLDDVFNPEHLKDKVPRMSDVLEGAAHLRDLFVEADMDGYNDDRSMQRIAKIDTDLQIALDQFHEAGCQCQQGLWGANGHRAWFLKWLDGPGKAFDLRNKNV